MPRLKGVTFYIGNAEFYKNNWGRRSWEETTEKKKLRHNLQVRTRCAWKAEGLAKGTI